MKARAARLIACVVLALCLFLFAAVLANIPTWYRTEGLPLFPALLTTQAMVLAVALCTYGLYAILLKPKLARMQLARQRRNPTDAPWAHNKQWVRKRVNHSSVGVALFLWYFAANWWGALAFFATERTDAILNAPPPELALGGLLVILGLITIRMAVIKTIDWFRFGRSTLVIETLPGRPGQTFIGHIETGFKSKPRQAIELTLTGFTRHWTESEYIPHEENRRVGDVRTAAPFHETSEKLPPSRLVDRGGDVVIPVRFDIPRDAPSSGHVDGGIEVVWRISARSTGKKGKAFDASFEIPVYGY